MGLTKLDYVIYAHWTAFITTLVFLVISTILLEISLSRGVTDKVVCSENDVSDHYWKSIQTIIVGSIIGCHHIIEIGFFLYFPIEEATKSVSDQVRKFYLRRTFRMKNIFLDLARILILLIILSIVSVPCVLELYALFDVIGAEFSSKGIVNNENPESKHCCGSSAYTHGLIPNYSEINPPSLNFGNEIFHCRAPNFQKDFSTVPCCCFEPKRIVSYLNLAAYNIFIFSLRLLFWSFFLVGAAVMVLTEDDIEFRRQRQNISVACNCDTRRHPTRASTLARLDHDHNEMNDPVVAYHVISQREPSLVLPNSRPRGVGKFTCAAGQTRNQVKHDVLMVQQRQSNNLVHLAYTFHSCTIEYWMDLSLNGVTVNGAYNAHQIDIQNYVAGEDSIDVLKDSFGGFVVIVIAGNAVKGLLLATGADALPNPLKVEFPTMSDARIEVRTPRMPLPNVFGERKFKPGEESIHSIKLGDILIECRLDVRLEGVQIMNEMFSGRYTNMKLLILKYSKNDSIRTEMTDGGMIIIVIKNSECRGIAFVYAPMKMIEHLTILPGKDLKNSDNFVSLNFRDK